ncbi:MAG: type II toxin-antitoxin system VapC family toxin [Chloroflexi bacterium]|nr:type II toxin-antitoxin system VapC family toxin [Chloroflexota bacterium]
MIEAPRYVVDASVAVKWLLQDEDHAQSSLAVLQQFREDRIALLAPDHIRYEVLSAVRNAVVQQRVSSEAGRQAIRLFLALRLPRVQSESVLLLGFEQSLRYGCGYYDGLYVGLAESSRCPLLHADDKLRRTLRGRCPFELWIEDYRPAAV